MCVGYDGSWDLGVEGEEENAQFRDGFLEEVTLEWSEGGTRNGESWGLSLAAR